MHGPGSTWYLRAPGQDHTTSSLSLSQKPRPSSLSITSPAARSSIISKNAIISSFRISDVAFTTTSQAAHIAVVDMGDTIARRIKQLTSAHVQQKKKLFPRRPRLIIIIIITILLLVGGCTVSKDLPYTEDQSRRSLHRT